MDHEVEHDVHLRAALLEGGEPLALDEERPRHALGERAERLVVALDVSRLEHQLLAFGELDQLVGLGERGGDRLFDQEVQTLLQALSRHRVVAIGRHRDDRRIDLAERLAIVGERSAVELLCERRGARAVSIDHRDKLCATQRSELLRVVAPHVAGTDHGDLQ